jgi:hypothetical protein
MRNPTFDFYDRIWRSHKGCQQQCHTNEPATLSD